MMMVVVVVMNVYWPPKNLLKPWKNELRLPLVRSGRRPCDGRTIATKSSYVAWVSRGFWPKRPKAQGAVVDVGKREKGVTLEDIVVKLRIDWYFLGWVKRAVQARPRS
jgi:hypothetical protein